MRNSIPHIIHVFPSFGRGGVPIKICHSINYFGNQARHTIISTNNDFGAEDLIDDGLNVAIDKSHHDTKGSLLHFVKKHRSYLKNENADLLKSRLEKINSLNEDELKAYYKEVLNNGMMSDKGGGGLGMIDIARKSGQKLAFDFQKVDDEYSFYSLNINIPQ